MRGTLAGSESVRDKLSTTRRTAGVHSRKRPLGPDGEKICYNCGGPLPKGKPFNCSPKCSDEWQMRTSPAHARFRLFQRDKGICVLCKTDTVALSEEYRKLPHGSRDDRADGNDVRSAFLKAHGIPPGRSCSDWWDADHITPVIEGGGECGLDNLRTLCLPCHKKETKQLHDRLADERNDENNGDWVRLAEDAEEQASIASRRARDLKKAAAIFRANAKQIPP